MAVSYRFDENGNELPPEAKTVSQVNEYVKCLIEEEKLLSDIYVSAEISNFKNHYSSGHLYFTLKDEQSEIKAIMFRSYASKVKFQVKDGMKVLVHARVGVYEKGGTYQLYVDSMQPDGIGALYFAYEQLKAKLEKEGLFDENHKKKLPSFPSKIGIITSDTGAAVRDIIKVSKRRYPGVRLVLFPTLVQGSDAPAELINAIEYFNITKSVDVIIIGRGGGSLEDLWAFNDEGLTRAVYNSKIPIVSAVGHEIDFTICDFVADVRAATPSHAAELVTPCVDDLKYHMINSRKRIVDTVTDIIETYRSRIEEHRNSKVLSNPLYMFDTKKMRIFTNAEKLELLMKSKVETLKSDLGQRSASLVALNPMSVLARGYGAVFRSDNKIIKSINNVEIGEKVTVKISDGSFDAKITDKYGKEI